MNDDESTQLKILEFLAKIYEDSPHRNIQKTTVLTELNIKENELERIILRLEYKNIVKLQKYINGWFARLTPYGYDFFQNLSNINNEKSEHSTNSMNNFSLILEPEHLISKFKQCLKELDDLQNPQYINLVRIMNNGKLPDNEQKLLNISKRIRNLVKIGFTDGKERSEMYTIEGGNFYKRIQTEGQPFHPIKDFQIFSQHVDWHRIKVKEFLDEVELIRDSMKNKTVTDISNTQVRDESIQIPVDEFNGLFSVFISHKFVKEDQLLALELRTELRKNNIVGYLAESKKEYELLIGNKIREAIDKSEYVVAIITKHSQTSASVNQELGYALGIKKPIVIMIEKDAQHGVLTYGLEPEEFTRENFVNHCKTVTKYILNKGKRNVSNKTPQILRETIYPELYDKMMKIYENSDAFKILTVNPWKDISPSSKLKIEEDIKQLFEEFTSKLSDWHTTLSRVNQNFTINKAKLGEIITSAFARVSLTKPDEMIILDSHSSQYPKDWIDAFKFIIFDEEIINEQILYEKLVKFARDTENGHLRWLQDWKTQKPTLFGHIFDTLPQLREVLRVDFINEDMQKEKESISILVEKIIKILENRIS
jgi:hypothetical protein